MKKVILSNCRSLARMKYSYHIEQRVEICGNSKDQEEQCGKGYKEGLSNICPCVAHVCFNILGSV